MVLVTTTSAPDALYLAHTGTLQEVLDATEASLAGQPHRFLTMYLNGTNHTAILKAK